MSKVDREKNWELVQIKAFTAWLNSYLQQRNLHINDIKVDLQDGVLLCSFLEIATKKKLTKKWWPVPKRKIQKIENLAFALDFIVNDLTVKLVGIGSEDVFDCNVKLILGLVWSLFRQLRMRSLEESSGNSLEEGLLKWVREQTAGYEGVNVTDFKYSFGDGLAFAALVNKYDPSFLDYDALDKATKSKEKKAEILNHAFEIAEQRMAIPKLLDVDELIAGDPDERSVQLYVSLIFHAFATKAEREKMDAEAKKTTSKLEDIKADLDRTISQKEALLKEIEALKSGIKGKGDDADFLKRLAELQKQVKELEEEIKKLKELLAKYQRLKELEGEVDELEESLTDLLAQGLDTEEAREREHEIQEELASKRQELERLRKEIDEEDEEREEISARSRELEVEKERLVGEVEHLTSDLDEELEARRSREELNKRLKKENEMLKKKAEIEEQARATWDLIRKNLQAHLEDSHAWKEVMSTDAKRAQESGAPKTIEGKFVDVSGVEDFVGQIAKLNSKLESANANITKVLTTTGNVGKKGWLYKKGPKDWRKRWFVMRGSTLAYFRKEDDTGEAGSISLEGCEVGSEKVKEGEKRYPLKIVVGGRKLILQAETEEERDSWVKSLRDSLAGQKDAQNASKSRADPRLPAFYASKSSPTLYLDDKLLTLDQAKTLAEKIPAHPELQILSIENAGLTDDHVKALASAISGLKKLKVLRFGKNNLSAAGAETIAGILQKNKSITELHLNDNSFDEEGITALADGIKDHLKLEMLDISGTKATGKAVADLAKAMGAEHKLRSLLLSRNQVDDQAATEVGELFKKNASISVVHLQANNISDAGVQAIVEGLRKNKSVLTIDLSNNNISSEGALMIKNMLKKNHVLETVALSGNKISGGKALSEFLDTPWFFFSDLSFRRIVA